MIVRRYMLAVLVFSIVLCAGIIKAGAEEISDLQAQMDSISAQIGSLKQRLSQANDEYIDAEKQLQKQMSQQIDVLSETMDKDKARKSLIAENRQRHAQLRDEYRMKKAPISEQMHQLKIQEAGCKKRIKELQKQQEKAQKEASKDHIYLDEMKDLKAQLHQAKKDFIAAEKHLQKKTKEDIMDLSKTVGEEQARKQLFAPAKEQERKLRLEYRDRIRPIKDKIAQAEAAHRERETVKDQQQAMIDSQAAVVEAQAADKAPALQNFGTKK